MSRARGELSRLYVILDRSRHKDVTWLMREVCEGGAKLLLWRDKAMTLLDFFNTSQELLMIAQEYGATLLVHDRADVALALNASGVHRPGSGLPDGALRAVLGPERVLGASLHSVEEVAEAGVRGVLDFATVSPAYLTDSKPGYGPALGCEGLKERVAASAGLPLYALGGITPERVPECLDAGAYGVAVMGGICGSDDPRGSTLAYSRFFS